MTRFAATTRLLRQQTVFGGVLSLPGLAFWAKADSLALADGTAVSTWTDSSGNGRDATMTSTNRPLLKTAVYNGLSTVRFDGVDDIMRTANWGLSSATAHLFLVCKMLSTATGKVLFDGLTTNTLQVNRATATAMRMAQGSSLDVTTTPEALHVYSMEFTASTSSAIRADGGTATTGAAGGNTGAGGLALGARNDLGTVANVDICEIILCTSIQSTQNRQNTEAYLKAKWGTP